MINTSPNAQALKSFFPFIIALISFALIGLGLATLANDYVQLVFLFVCSSIILALSLNLVNGFTGQFSLGHAGFMAIGGYVSAYLSTQIVHDATFFDFLWFALVGGIVAGAAGFVVGMPSLRLRGDYLAIVTLGFGEMIRVVFLNMPAVGGARGMSGIPRPHGMEFAGFTFTPFYMEFLAAGFWVVITFLVLWRMIKSVHGRTFLSVREDEIAAQAMGINTTAVKVKAFVISSFFAGISGAVFAHAVQFLSPATFDFRKSVDAIIMVVLGGMGSLTGSVVAAIFVTIIPEFVLRPLQEYTGVDLRMVIYSLALILFMIARPKGIFGTLELPDLWRRNGRSSRR
jgi:branched-chain amino acid transport system permease protein